MAARDAEDPLPETGRPSQGDGGAAPGSGGPSPDGGTDAALAADIESLRMEAARAEELFHQLQRTTADLRNLQNRLSREKELARKLAVRDLVRALLPAFDNLGRALEAGARGPLENVVAGVRLVDEEIHRTLADHGIEAIVPAEEPLDPNVHEAVVQQPSATVPAGRIVGLIEKGYRLGDLVVRPARVVVSSGKVPGPGEDASTTGPDADLPRED